MVKIKTLYDVDGNKFVPRTHVKAVTDDNGNSLASILDQKVDDSELAEVKSIAETAKNAVATLEGLSNTTTAQETLAAQVTQIEENKQNIALNKADADAKLTELASEIELKYPFVFGGLDRTTGWYLDNNIRIRTYPISVGQGSTTVRIVMPDGFEITSGYTFTGDVPYGSINYMLDTDGCVTVTSDGYFDNVVFSLKKTDGTEITDDERAECYAVSSDVASAVINNVKLNNAYYHIEDSIRLEYGHMSTYGSFRSDSFGSDSWGLRHLSSLFLDVSDCYSISFSCGFPLIVYTYDKNYTYIRKSADWMEDGIVFDFRPSETYIKIMADSSNLEGGEYINVKMSVKSKKPHTLKRCYNTRMGTHPNSTDGIVNIEYPMRLTNPQCCASVTTDVQDGNTVLYPNYGLLLLPDSYNNTGEPTPLLVFCHGYSAHYGSTSTTIASTSHLNTEYLLKEGYAILDMDGNLLGRTKPHACSQMGVDSYIRGIKWVQDRYNVTKDIYLAGHSMGGMMASLLSTIGNSIHIKACCLFSPATSIILLMQLHPEHRSDMAQYYGFEGVEPTWGSSADFTEEEKQYIMDNIEKVMKGSILWNYTNILPSEISGFTHKYGSIPTSEETTFYSSKSRILPHVPTKVFQGTTDYSCKKEWTDEFVKLCKNGGMNIEYRIMEGVPHTGDSGITAVGNNTVTTIYGEIVEGVPTTLYEMVRFFRRYC